MARQIHQLTVRKIAALTAPGRHADGGNLYLVVSKGGAKKWSFMWSRNGRQREMGLGSALSVSLSRARERADQARRLLAEGIDPLESRVLARTVKDERPTFGEIAEGVLKKKGEESRNQKHASQWRSTLETYAGSLWNLPVEDVDTNSIVEVLQPIWLDKNETASRLRGRIEAVLDAAQAKGHRPRNEANPARWKGHLDKLLPKRKKLARGHHAAMPYADIPAFLKRLQTLEAVAARALEFTILTAARSGEVLGARWDEIDFEEQVWTVPAERMKAGREHRVPLCRQAIAIMKSLEPLRNGEFVFPGQKQDKPLSNMAMEMVLRRMKVEDVTVHGFRSSFRDWAGNETEFPRELAEAALAHVIGDKAEQAYRRSDALERRRALMNAWEVHIYGQTFHSALFRTQRNSAQIQ
ncbi:tyrosine-type recombinase/integrase [Beijerinckia mobilis]|uniref:tyrosine-type recombinase/integrase n=1 Tax=Beijerinckia mobilis TaxID=231434 RepID=UPI0009FDAB0A|nr:integrase arm-type DNA-binding domain-containing protein [Beijerinckia mobilis]